VVKVVGAGTWEGHEIYQSIKTSTHALRVIASPINRQVGILAYKQPETTLGLEGIGNLVYVC
jgi:hypothetical protein